MSDENNEEIGNEIEILEYNADVPNPALEHTAAQASSNVVYAISIDKGKTVIKKQIPLGGKGIDGLTELWECRSLDGGKHYSTYRKFQMNGKFVPVDPNPPPPTPTPIPTPPPVPTPTPPPPGPVIPIKGIVDVINYSTTTSDAIIKGWCDAIKVQCDRDVYPFWGYTVQFNMLLAAATPSADPIPIQHHWHCGIFDDSDQAGVLGWHDSGPDGEPIIKVFTKEAAKYHLDSGVTLSHEILETIGDTDANTTIEVTNSDTGKLRKYYLENCDPTEAFTYQINGINVSDFVTRNWFQQSNPANTKFDYLGLCKAPFQILNGGYMYVWDEGIGWHELNEKVRTLSSYKTTPPNTTTEELSILDNVSRRYVIGRRLPKGVTFHDQAGIHQRRYRRKKSRLDWILSDYNTQKHMQSQIAGVV